MNTHTNCCGETTVSCDGAIAELPRYYPRQLITPDDLTLEQNYFRDRMRRHNRLLHGWGVVCGALVCPATTKDANGVVSVAPWQVQVQPGYILGPYGDEIILSCTRTVDLRTNGVSGVTTDEPCVDVPDPWCSQVTVPRGTGPLYVAIKYKQSMTRPVRVQPIGCGCDDNTCECSRWHDGYEIGILPCCPDEGQSPPNVGDLFKGDVLSCPACPPQPWVVLATVQVGADGTISSIDNCDCRRLVASWAGFWWKCSQGDTTLTGPTSAVSTPAGQTTKVTVTGTNLDPKATYTFGNGVMVTVLTTDTAPLTSIDLNVSPDSSADPGPRTLVVVNPDCSTVTLTAVISVVGPQTTSPVAGGGQKPSAPSKPSPSKPTPVPRKPRTPPAGPQQPS